MTTPDYIQDAKDIASKLARQEAITMEHRRELMALLHDLKQSLEDWKDEATEAHRGFHGRLSALEESKGVRNTLLVGGGGLLGALLAYASKKLGL